MSTPQVIEATAAYTVPEFKRRLGIADHAFKQLRRGGLRVIHPGGAKKPFLLGSDWLDFLTRAAEQEESS